MSQLSSPSHSAFFYGTLMSPSVLHRVTHRPLTQPFTVCPAVLPGFRRHRVRDADYPAVLPVHEGSHYVVHGTYVQGLTDRDMLALDVFEGDEYERRKVLVELRDRARKSQIESKPHNSKIGKLELSSARDEVSRTLKPEPKLADAEVYVWVRALSYLEDEEWDFNEFTREKLHRWAPSSSEYQEVDQALEDIGVRETWNVVDGFYSVPTDTDCSENSEVDSSQKTPGDSRSVIGWRHNDPTGGRNINSRVFEEQLSSTT